MRGDQQEIDRVESQLRADGFSEDQIREAVAGPGGRLIQLSFQPSGIAVDAARGRIYISDALGNAVWVYTTKGKFLRTIK
jgi:hypothetical protein